MDKVREHMKSSLPAADRKISDKSSYVIAAIIIGGVLGNIFSVRRLKSMKFRTPGAPPSANEPWQPPSPSNFYYNEHITEKNYAANIGKPFTSQESYMRGMGSHQSQINSAELTFMSVYRTWKESGYQSTATRPKFAALGDNLPHTNIPALNSKEEWLHYLSVLNLSEEFVPSRAEVKDAYRALALKLHPDTASSPVNRLETSPDASKGDPAAFASVTEAYRGALNKIDHLETRLKV